MNEYQEYVPVKGNVLHCTIGRYPVQYLEAVAYLVLDFMVLLSLSIRTVAVIRLMVGKANFNFRCYQNWFLTAAD